MIKANKDYMITVWSETEYAVHKNIGGGAYIAVFFGTHNETARWLKENGISDIEMGE